ncbi:hypothetical protein JOD97_000752 [Duganella sp. 1411]|uniref:eCIS core domain-containing protein n=1 Tax=Duganella sp. 1411 TaxID=2806572 RepID=UPI001AE1ADE4|nr:DUF4157 domain-containing protein [Duganella sp. 1411]MBP1202738.1 hypothetical protein [Duganella sp. 1411]
MSYSSDRRQSKAGAIQPAALRNSTASIVDRRASASAHLQLKQKIDESPIAATSRSIKQLMSDEELEETAPAQLVEDEDETLQGKFATVQRAQFDEEEDPLQGKFSGYAPAQLADSQEARPNNTGLPDNLKAGIENLSGMSMDHVKVHYNSSQPAQLNAHAYAQGSDIHVAPGQERHVPHEAWHVVQQAQGRVKPTLQMKGGVPLNDNTGLEIEADLMGEKALAAVTGNAGTPDGDRGTQAGTGFASAMKDAIVQRSIGCHLAPGGAGYQFQIDDVRPGWEPHAAAIAIAANQDRAHLIAFEVIQNDLANILNTMLANVGTVAFTAAPLNALCAALFVTAGAEMNTMNNNRAGLIAVLAGVPAGGVLTAIQQAALTAYSGALLSNLNSCLDNLRAGDRAANISIGYSVDAEFNPGTVWYHGPILASGAAPAAAVPPGGVAVMGPGGGPGSAGPFEAVRLTAAHEAKVYAYQNASTLPLSFVVSGGGGAVLAGTVAGQQLSSTQLPTAAGYPVIVFGGGSPLVFA